jgi:hypothetical protein
VASEHIHKEVQNSSSEVGQNVRGPLQSGAGGGKTGRVLETLADYIHLNRARAGLIKPKKGESILDYPWSSVTGGYALAPRRRAQWLAVETGLSIFGSRNTVAGRRAMVERLDRRALEEGKCSAPAPLFAR